MAEHIKVAIPNKNIYDKAIWLAILKLVEDSNFGQKSAQVEMVIPESPNFNVTNYILGGGDDGVFIEIIRILNTIFSGRGQVEIVPYSKGLGTRTAILKFLVEGSSFVMSF